MTGSDFSKQITDRLTYDLDSLAEDIGLIGTESPFILGLTQRVDERDMTPVRAAVEDKRVGDVQRARRVREID